MEEEKKKVSERHRRRETDRLKTHLFKVLDLVFCDDAVGLLRLLPGELDAALLHFLPDDLADLGWSCLDKSMSVSEGQAPSARTHTAYSGPQIGPR